MRINETLLRYVHSILHRPCNKIRGNTPEERPLSPIIAHSKYSKYGHSRQLLSLWYSSILHHDTTPQLWH